MIRITQTIISIFVLSLVFAPAAFAETGARPLAPFREVKRDIKETRVETARK